MDFATSVGAFVRMMKRYDELKGISPGAFEALEWRRTHARMAAYQSAAVSGYQSSLAFALVDAWEHRLQLDQGQFTASRASICKAWEEALREAQAWPHSEARERTCATCRHRDRESAGSDCRSCLRQDARPYWEPSDEVLDRRMHERELAQAIEQQVQAAFPAVAAVPMKAPSGQSRPGDAAKALKRRFKAYGEAVKAQPADASHVQLLVALARAEGFASFQALAACVDASRPAFCPFCGAAGLKQADGVSSCGRCNGTFALAQEAGAATEGEQVLLEDVQREALEELGYEVGSTCANPKDPAAQLWHWTAPDSECMARFATESQAWRDAWLDAVQQTLDTSDPRVGEVWGELTPEAQAREVLAALSADA